MCNSSNLPSDIIIDILTRLPIETILDCKLVCKPWRNLISIPSFSQMHLTHLNDHAGNLTFLTLTPYHGFIEHQQFHYFEYINNDEKHRITRININPPFKDYNIIASSNGLICLIAYHEDYYLHTYICNPVTREYVILKEFNRVRSPDDYCVYSGFGYLCETCEYKVVRIYQLRGQPNFECVEVYTLGSASEWRNVGECGLLSFCVSSFVNDYGVFASETLYWITAKGEIVAFNLADEKFCQLPTLPSLSLADNRCLKCFEIGVLGGVLCCSIHDIHERRTDIWLLKKNGNQNMMEQEKYMSFTWGDKFIHKKPLALMKSGEVLLCSATHLYSYDIKSSCLKTLVNFPQHVCQTIPHMNTLISLKALGEVDTKTME